MGTEPSLAAASLPRLLPTGCNLQSGKVSRGGLLWLVLAAQQQLKLCSGVGNTSSARKASEGQAPVPVSAVSCSWLQKPDNTPPEEHQDYREDHAPKEHESPAYGNTDRYYNPEPDHVPHPELHNITAKVDYQGDYYLKVWTCCSSVQHDCCK